MNTKKLLSIVVVLTLVLSMFPAIVMAQTATFSITGPRVECVRTRAATDAPALSAGNHQSYLDRVASMPDYALEYYHWLEENAGPDGILVDPTKSTEYDGEYYYAVHYATGTEKFTFTSDTSTDEIRKIGGEIATAGLDKEFTSFGNWTSVVHDIFDREHPEVFWLSGRSSVSYMGNWTYSIRGNTCTVMYQADMVVWLKYDGFDIRHTKYQDLDTLTQSINTRDAMVQEILADCPEGSDYDRVVYLNDALTARNAYNSAVASGKSSKAEDDAWECISALVGNSGTAGPVCEGYSRAFQVLCNELNIPCVLVDGEARMQPDDYPENHMWNYVQIDGGWYALDVTWNDPYASSMPEEKNTGYENRYWFLLGSDSEVAPGYTFLESHTVENQVRSYGLSFTNGPVLEQTAYNPDAAPAYSVSGKVTSANADDVTVELLQDGVVVETKIFSGKSVEYTFENILAGSYQLKVSKADFVTYTVDLTVADEAVIQDLKLRMLGDVTGDGRINVGDVARLYGHNKRTAVVTDPYILLCMDITSDGRINVGDTARLYARVRG